MIYGIKYDVKRNEIYTFEAGNFTELKNACSSPVWWLIDEILITAVEAESLEEANRKAAEKICKFFEWKKKEALEKAARYETEASKYDKFERGVKYADFIGDKKKIYSVCYHAGDGNKHGDKLVVNELPDEDDQTVCDKAYQTDVFLYEVFVEAADEKEAKIKGAEAIAKFIEKERVAAGKAVCAVYDREMRLRNMRVWLEDRVKELGRT